MPRRNPDSVPGSSGRLQSFAQAQQEDTQRYVLPAVLMHSAGYFCWCPAVHVVDQRGGQVSGVVPNERHGLWPDHNWHADPAGEETVTICLPSL